METSAYMVCRDPVMVTTRANALDETRARPSLQPSTVTCTRP
jgi:hypothetical protein